MMDMNDEDIQQTLEQSSLVIEDLKQLLNTTTFPEIHEATAASVAFLISAQAALDQEDGDVLPEDEVDDTVAESIEDMASTLYQIFGIDVEENRMSEEEMMEASRYMGGVASFSQGFGSVLSAILQQRFETVDDGISLISEITGLENYEVPGLLDGSVVIDPETASELANAFRLDGGEFNEFVNLANQAYLETEGALDGSYNLGDITAEPVATMSADVQLRAEFEALKEQTAIGETLRAIERQCDQLVSGGVLTTHERRLLIGDFETNQDRVAQFSAACGTMNVPPGQQLDRIQWYLFIANQRGPIAQFGQYVDEPIEDISHDDISAIQSYRSRYGYQ